MVSVIRNAELDDRDSIQKFINDWKKDHILSKSSKLFDYMYKNKKTNRYNFLLSIKNNEINGILGFLPTNHFDEKIVDSSLIIWYSMWRVINMPGNNIQGIRLMKYLSKLYPKSNFGTVGANSATIPIYKSMKYHTGSLTNFVLFNPLVKNFKIAKVDNFIIPENKNSFESDGKIIEITLKLIKYQEEINKAANAAFNYKKFEFLNNRYINHPFLNYEIWLLDSNSIKSFLIIRRIKYRHSSYIKVVDYIGNRKNLLKFNFCQHSNFFKKSEYIEFRSFGLEKELCKAGFIDVTDDKNLVIPYYNDPFIFKNKKINWTLKIYNKENYIVTGDCDQDRPNRIINN